MQFIVINTQTKYCNKQEVGQDISQTVVGSN